MLEHLTCLAILGCSFQRGIYIGLSETRYVNASSRGLFKKQNKTRTPMLSTLKWFCPVLRCQYAAQPFCPECV